MASRQRLLLLRLEQGIYDHPKVAVRPCIVTGRPGGKPSDVETGCASTLIKLCAGLSDENGNPRPADWPERIVDAYCKSEWNCVNRPSMTGVVYGPEFTRLDMQLRLEEAKAVEKANPDKYKRRGGDNLDRAKWRRTKRGT